MPGADEPTDSGLSRRRALRAGCTTIAALTLAGCSEDGGSETATNPELPGYADWLFAPGAVGDRNHYFFDYYDYRDIRENEGQFTDQGYRNFEASARTQELGLSIGEIDTRISIGVGVATIIRGTFAANAVTTDLDANGYERTEEIGAYTVYTQGSQSAVAVTDDRAIRTTQGGPDPVANLRAVIDAGNGEGDRYGDTSDDFAALTSRLGDGTLVTGSTSAPVEVPDADQGRFEGEVASGSVTTVEGEQIAVEQISVFADERAVPLDEFQSYVEGSQFWEFHSNVDIKQDGRTVVVSGTIPTDEYNT